MKLVMIQGDLMAQYEGRKQMSVLKVNHWDFDVSGYVELLRTQGVEAFSKL